MIFLILIKETLALIKIGENSVPIDWDEKKNIQRIFIIMKILNIYQKHIFLIIFPLVLTLSSAQEDDPLGLSSNTALQKINSQYGQYFADKIVEMRGLRGQSQPREWTVVVNDERSQLRLRTVRVSVEKSINEGESSKFYPRSTSLLINKLFSICDSFYFSNPSVPYHRSHE